MDKPTVCPLLVEGTIDHPEDAGPLEYSILLEVHDQAGKLVSRQTAGVGAFRQAEKRIFSVRVELSSPPAQREKPGIWPDAFTAQERSAATLQSKPKQTVQHEDHGKRELSPPPLSSPAPRGEE